MAVDYFLKIEGIDGESQDAKHKGEIELASWSWGESNAGAGHFGGGGGGGAGKVSMQDFHFTSRVDKSSPKLFLACASGQHIKTAVITCRKAGGAPLTATAASGDQIAPTPGDAFLAYKLADVFVSSYQIGGGVDSELPAVQFSLNFAKIEVDFRPQNAEGGFGQPIVAGWDLVRNVKL